MMRSAARYLFKGPRADALAARGLSSKPIEWFPKPLKTKQRGIDILHDPLWNKSTAFNYDERDRLGLRGLLPPGVRDLDSQVERVMTTLRSQPNNITKSLYLQDTHNRNETLYHRVLVDNIEEIAPLVYTPTVGDVCLQFGDQFRRSRGMYFSRDDKGQFSSMVYNWPHDDVHVIVVTDGSRILGLGDLGVHGMGIPIGKLALYCAAGGIAPHRVLPVTIDVGTNNKALLNDPSYLGVRKPRLTGDEYFSVLDEFIGAVFSRWPGVVVQFEDFESTKASALLERYRYTHRVFNDDIQGTGCVTLAGIMSAARNAGSSITEMRFLCAGSGSAGLGVCSQIVDGMVEAGMSRDEAMKRFVVVTSVGAIGRPDGKFKDPNHSRGLSDERKPWVNTAVSDGADMLTVVKEFKPTCLLGLSTVPNVFTEPMIRQMNADCIAKGIRPIVMPMSNPTSKSECSPEQAYTWTNGNAVVATGSPFSPVTFPDGRKFIPSQCNNMYVFPGLGLAASVAGVRVITDKMLYRAAVACTNTMNEEEKSEGRTFPNIRRIREVSQAVACAVIEEAIDNNLTTKITKENSRDGIASLVKRKMYFPNYVPLINKERD